MGKGCVPCKPFWGSYSCMSASCLADAEATSQHWHGGLCLQFWPHVKHCSSLPPSCLQGEGVGGVKKLVESKGLMQISDPTQIEAIVDKVLAASPQQLELFRGGKTKLQGFFVG